MFLWILTDIVDNLKKFKLVLSFRHGQNIALSDIIDESSIVLIKTLNQTKNLSSILSDFSSKQKHFMDYNRYRG